MAVAVVAGADALTAEAPVAGAADGAAGFTAAVAGFTGVLSDLPAGVGSTVFTLAFVGAGVAAGPAEVATAGSDCG